MGTIFNWTCFIGCCSCVCKKSCNIPWISWFILFNDSSCSCVVCRSSFIGVQGVLPGITKHDANSSVTNNRTGFQSFCRSVPCLYPCGQRTGRSSSRSNIWSVCRRTGSTGIDLCHVFPEQEKHQGRNQTFI
ncbi:hypothetical protein DSECCO2_502980 [anaerobic digester metagenome]